MGQAQLQQQQQQDTTPQNQHLLYLQKNASTAPHFIYGMQEDVSFDVQCPRCKKIQFNDQLGRATNCYNCKLVFTVNDGIVQISSDIGSVEDRRTYQLIENNFTYLESVTFYVNSTKLDPCLIKNGIVDYQTLMKNVLLPFFSVRQRVVSQGVRFMVGPFEFRSVGGFPNKGIVTKQTEIYCYGSYSEQPANHIRILSQKQSRQLDLEIKSYLFNHPNENLMIQDGSLRINQQQLLILYCENSSGIIQRNSIIESVHRVSNLQHLKLSCIKSPVEFQQIPQQRENARIAILKAVIQPYFSGLTRYLQKGQIIKIGEFEFEANMFEEWGLVVPHQTIVDLEMSSWRQQLRAQHMRQGQQELILPQIQFPLTRSEIHRHHAQQIDALHRLLNTFILLNENQQLLVQLTKGASVQQINQLPIRQIDPEFLKSHQLDEDHSKCMICLESYNESENVRTMPCWHYFHQHCIDQWLNKSTQCPICKTEIDIQQEEELSLD